MVYSFHLHPRSSLGRGVDASMRNGVGSDHAIAAAARAWTCDSDKQYDSGTLSGQCVNGVSSLKSTFAGVGIDCSGGRTAGKRWSRTRRGGAG